MSGTRIQVHREQSIDREIWGLLWPLLILTAIQRLGSMFEGVLVSVNSTDELTITSFCTPYINLISTISYGIGIGTNAFVSKLTAGNLWEGCCRRMARMVILVLVVGSLSISGISALVLWASFASIPHLAHLGWLYMLPYLFGSPVILLYQLLLSAMRGFHDTKTGMWMTVLSVPIQLLVCWGGYTLFGIAGLGYGTLAARGIACLLGLWKIRPYFQTKRGNEQLPKGSVREFVALSVPVSLAKAIMPVANAAINPLVLSIGAVYVSASGLAGRFEGFFYLAAMSMGSVAITMAAGDKSRYGTKKLLKHLCLWSMTPTIVMIVLAWIFAAPFWSLLTPDAVLQRAGMEYWHICLLAYPLISLEMTLTGILQAKGQGMPALVITVIRTWCVQLPITWAAVRFDWGAKGAWMAYLLGNLVSVLIIGVWAYLKLRAPKNGKISCDVKENIE